ncbi:serine/threonine protein kinase [Oscillatoriales cyanobacterium LEGE 11467]|uniref:non-specific serine/threonine protein kinase n=1 Tax=Zarconia navalis LEGE 11467 TaxID=1828826 RepID=A0A928VWX6_9CYAN|nr:serine/threonine-protein kinase [Zarconia navalis]MBE9041742.1 serine/threonine protein kinase [Zarconia navalis LEGE 11467]
MLDSLHQINDIITDRYRIAAVIGKGAFGTTYEAEDLSNYQRVAIKVLSLQQAADWKAIDLFEREAQVLATLNHPSIPKYLDYFHRDTSSDRQFYLVQELIEGESLAERVQKGWRATEEQVYQIGVQVLEILNYLHRLSPPVIHRDIKPQNIIRRPNGQVYLVDFGAVQDVYRHTLVSGGTFVGTVGYMPPEQFRGKAFFGSDLYALGATLLFLFAHRSPDELPQKRMKIDFRDRIQMSPAFASWLEKMLEPAIEDRYHSAQEALGVLENLYDTPPPLKTMGTIYIPRPAHQPPKGSQLKIQRDDWYLVIQSRTKAKNTAYSSLIFLISWVGLIVVIALFLMFLSPIFFLMIAITCIPIFASAAPGNNHFNLFVNQSELKIEHPLWYKQTNVSIPIDRIQDIYLDVQTSFKGIKKINCAIKTSFDRHEFGYGLTPVEKQWLVDEVSDFLTTVRSSDRAPQK